MKPICNLKTLIASTVLSVFSALNASAQTQAIWSGPASGGEWNTPANWTTANTPGEGTNVVVGANTNVSYNTPMAAGSFNTLTNRGTINVNAGGFVIGGSGTPMLFYTATAKMFVNSGGAVSVTNGSGSLTTNSSITVAAGGSFTLKNTLSVGQFGNSSSGGGSGFFTNNGGSVTLGGLTVNNSGNNQNCIVQINGGTNNLGNVTVQRGGISSFGANVVEGLQIFNGFVNMNNLNVGGSANSSVTTWVSGGIVTNNGNMQIHQATAGRGARFLQTGGYFVTADPGLVIPNPLAVASGSPSFSIYSITGGTNFAGGIFCTGSVGTVIGSVLLTNSANIYLGSGGIATDGSVTVNSSLNNGGLYGAYADWTNAIASKLNGASSTFTFRAADISGTPHNITVSGVISSGGLAATLNKTGAGVLTLNAAHTYLGTTLIREGTLALGPSGSVASTPVIALAGTTYDVSAVSGGYTLPAGQTIAGLGVVTGAVNVASAGILNPGSNTINGTLTFSNSITETGSATNHFDLIGTPGAGNDTMVIAGDFNASGLNYVEINGGVIGNVYPLFQYGGAFNGDAAVNLTVVGSPGTLSNSVANKTIYLISLNTERSATNIVWVGNAATNVWDINLSTNWSINGSLNHFMNGDNVTFDDTGAANPNVVLDTNALPASTTFASSSTYVLSGAGSIGGIGSSLTKDNTGTLVLLTTNTYTGPTIIKGGVLEVGTLANGAANSPIGASVSDPSTLVITNGTLRYTGDSVVTDRAATLGGIAALDITNGASTLTISGGLSGGGTLTKSGNGTLLLSAGSSYSGGTILNAGTLALKVSNGALGSGEITINGGTLSVGTNKPANTLNISNQCLITGGSSGGLGGIRNVNGSSNIVVAVTTGVFDLIGDVSAYSGTITFSNAGGTTIRLNGSTGSRQATWNLGTGGIDLVERSSSVPCYFGALMGDSTTTLSGRTASDNNGPTTYQIGDNNLSTTFDGVIRNGALSAQILGITKSGTGTLTLSGVSTYSGITTVSNGVLALTGSATIDNSTNIVIPAGGVMDVSGRVDSTLTVNTASVGQTLRGNGLLRGSLTAASGATVAPGNAENALGLLTITNTVTLASGSTTKMDLSTATATNDVLVADGPSGITYGGTLRVNLLAGGLTNNQVFKLFSAPFYTGSFSGISPVTLNGMTWDTSNLAVDGTLKVVTGPSPSIASFSASGLDLNFAGGNGVPTGTYYVLTSTNLALPLAQWTSVYTNTFDVSGNFTFTLSGALDPANPQQFYIVKPQ